MGIKVVLFFLVVSVSLFASSAVIDSLLNELQHSTEKEYVNKLNRISREYSAFQPDSSLFYAQKALEEARKQDYEIGEVNALSNIGFYYFDLHQYDKALQFQKESLVLSEDVDFKIGKANALNNIGNIYEAQSSYDYALECHLKALDINREIGIEERIATSYNNIGNIYYCLSNYEKALEYYQNSLELKERSGKKDKIAGALSNIGNVYLGLEEDNKAIEYYQQALNLMIEIDHKQGIAHFTNNIGIIYGDLGNYEEALKFLTSARKAYEELGDKRGLARSLYNMANLQEKLLDPQKSLEYLSQSLALALEVDDQDIILNSYELYSNLYKKQKNFEKALDFHELYTTLKDSIFSQESSNKIAEMQVKFETEKKEKENEIYRLELEKQKLIKWRLYFGLIILFIITFLFYYRYKSKQKINVELREKIEEALRKQKEQQQIIVHQANLSSLGEMAAGIAHEINQPLQNISLSAESMEIELNEKKLDNKYLRQKLKYIYEDIDRIKTISEHISTFSSEQKNEITEKFCLNESVKNAVSMIKKQFEKNNVELQIDLKDDLSKIEGNLYKFEQVVLNLLSNAKDAVLEDENNSQKQVVVRSNETDSEVFLEVEDNGIGISQSVKTNIFLPFFTTKKFGEGTGLGLSIAYGIIKEMNGKIELLDTENTIFQVIIPKEN
ncbi:MAG: tetratricopeptide repeat protein [Candidatus Cloacimonadales bacterium]|nr:tetratricopeptide repeat protein [Candidatus Cloacimonadales bacterium]